MAARPGRWIVLTAILAVCGCSEPDSIRVHDETPPPRPKGPTVSAEEKKFRTLAAMVPADSGDDQDERDPHWWFLKISGQTAVVSKYETDFNLLINSIRSESNPENPITWMLPSGWKREAAAESRDPFAPKRFATLKAPGGDAEVSVSQAGGMVVMNVKRWWIQLWGQEHAGDVSQTNVFDFAKQRLVNGRIIITVDLAGPKDPNAKDPNGGGPMMGHPHGGR